MKHDFEKIESGLKPCPFCGGKATLVFQKKDLLHSESWRVRCCNELCRTTVLTDWFERVESAADVWNTRGGGG